MPPPPYCQESAYFAESAFSAATSRCKSAPSGVVLDHAPHHPPSCGDGIVYQVHTREPVVPLNALRKPRMPYSPPDVPMITLSPTTSGAIVSVYPVPGSPTCVAHFSAPVC